MNRRGILGMLGMGAVAAPAIVHQYADVNKNPSAAYLEKAEQAVLWNPVEQLAEAQREYDYLTKDPAAWVADHVAREWQEYMDGYASYRYDAIDADIRALKSFSESAKMRMFFERKARRKQQQYSKSVLGRIQMLMKEV